MATNRSRVRRTMTSVLCAGVAFVSGHALGQKPVDRPDADREQRGISIRETTPRADAAQVIGRVVRPNGVPAPGVRIHRSEAREVVVTDHDGTFRIRLDDDESIERCVIVATDVDVKGRVRFAMSAPFALQSGRTFDIGTLTLRETADAVWTAPSHGAWDDPGNWRDGVRPGAGDVVFIPPTDGVVAIDTDVDIDALATWGRIEVRTGGRLTAARAIAFDETITVDGGAIVESQLIQTNVLHPLRADNDLASRLHDVMLTGELRLYALDALRIQDRLTVHGAINLVGPGACLAADGTVVIDGAAELRANVIGAPARLCFAAPNEPGTLRIANGIRVSGQNLVIGGGHDGNVAPQAVVLNDGRIDADVENGAPIEIHGGMLAFRNRGWMRVGSRSELIVRSLDGPAPGRLDFRSRGKLTLDGTYVINRVIDLPSFAELTLLGDWINLATIEVPSNGTLHLGGTVDPAHFGSLDIAGEGISIIGTVTNVGRTWEIDPALGSVTLNDGGTIVGGTVVVDPDHPLRVGGGAMAVMDAVIVEGDILLDARLGQLRLRNGLTLNGTLILDERDVELVIDGTQSIGGEATIRVGGRSWDDERRIVFAANETPATLTFESSVDILTGYLVIGGVEHGADAVPPANEVVLRGTLRTAQEFNGSRLIIDPVLAAFHNDGTIDVGTEGDLRLWSLAGAPGVVEIAESASVVFGGTYTIDMPLVVPGDSVVTLDGDWTNDSGVTVNATGELRLAGTFPSDGIGVISNPPGGTVRIEGTMLNDGRTFTLSPPMGRWELGAGVIVGGTIASEGNAPLYAASEVPSVGLDGVTLDGLISCDVDDAVLGVRNGLVVNGWIRVSGGNVWIALDGTQTVRGSGFIRVEAQAGASLAPLDASAVQTITLDVPVESFNGVLRIGSRLPDDEGNGACSVVARNLVRAVGTGGYVYVEPAGGTFSNEGALRVTNGGTIRVDDLAGELGTIEFLMDGEIRIDSGTYAIAQRIDVPANSVLQLGGNWTTSALITATEPSSELELDGVYDPDVFAFIASTGGAEITLNGTLVPSAESSTVTFASGAWRFDQADVVGVTIVAEPSATVRFDGDVGFENATLEGSFTCQEWLMPRERLTLNGDMTFTENGSGLYLTESVTLDGAAEYAFEFTGSHEGFIRFDADEVTLTIEQDVWVHGTLFAYSTWEPDVEFIVNHGRIEADLSDGAVVIDDTVDGFTGTGVLAASDGGEVRIREFRSLDELQLEFAPGGIITLEGTFDLVEDLTVDAGGTLVLRGTWQNLATITLEAGAELAVEQDGPADIVGSVVGPPSSFIAYRNLVENDGTTIVVSDVGPSFRLAGGTIAGGEVDIASGATFSIGGPYTRSRFDEVIVHGDMQVDPSEYPSLEIVGTVMFDGDLDLVAPDSELVFRGASSTLVGTSTIRQATAEGESVHIVLRGDGADPEVVLGSGITLDLVHGTIDTHGNDGRLILRGMLTLAGQSSATSAVIIDQDVAFVGEGAIEATGSGALTIHNVDGTLGACAIGGSSFVTFDGTYILDAPIDVGGSAALRLHGTWQNDAVIALSDDAGLELPGEIEFAALGSIVNQSSMPTVFSGVLQNTGQTFTIGGPDNAWRFASALVIGGTIESVGSDAVSLSGSEFDGVTLVGVFTNDVPSSDVFFVNGLVLEGELRLEENLSDLVFVGDGAVTGHGRIVSVDTSIFHSIDFEATAAANTFTIGADITVEGSNLRFGGTTPIGDDWTLINEGTLTGIGVGGFVQINNGIDDFVNHGVVQGIEGGRFTITSAAFLDANGRLPSGTWHALDDGWVDFAPSVRVEGLAPGVDVRLEGDGARFDGLDDLEAIDAGAILALRDGAALTATPANGTVFIDGTLAVHETSAFSVNGDLAFGATAMLVADLVDPIAPPVTATGSIAAAGMLDLAFIEGVEPMEVGTWEVAVSTAGWSGVFDDVVLSPPPAGLAYAVTYDALRAVLSVTAP